MAELSLHAEHKLRFGCGEDLHCAAAHAEYGAAENRRREKTYNRKMKQKKAKQAVLAKKNRKRRQEEVDERVASLRREIERVDILQNFQMAPPARQATFNHKSQTITKSNNGVRHITTQ